MDRPHHEHYLQAIFDTSLDAMISIDKDWRIFEWNRRAEEIFGWAQNEVLGQSLLELIVPPEDRADYESGMDAFLSGGPPRLLNRRFEVDTIHQDGRIIPVEMAVTMTRDAPEYCFTTFISDISIRKATEDEMRDYMAQLKRSNQELDDFVYIVSHDLKEPLRGLYSYAQILQEDYGNVIDEAGQDKLETLKKLAGRMENLIDTLLYFSRLGRGDVAFAETDLNEVLTEVLGLIAPVIERDNVDVIKDKELPAIYCDQARVGEIFRNLIINAIKYNEAAQKKVRVGYKTDLPEYEGRHVFYVRDNGIGIAPDCRASVFKMFKRLHGRNDYGGGTGAGLSFVKKLSSGMAEISGSKM